jgi:hypothetical protein
MESNQSSLLTDTHTACNGVPLPYSSPPHVTGALTIDLPTTCRQSALPIYAHSSKLQNLGSDGRGVVWFCCFVQAALVPPVQLLTAKQPPSNWTLLSRRRRSCRWVTGGGGGEGRDALVHRSDTRLRSRLLNGKHHGSAMLSLHLAAQRCGSVA